MARNRDRVEARIRRAVAKANDELEREFRDERADAAANFHNAIVAIIDEQAPSIETQLYVYEMLRHELLAQRARETFSPGTPVHIHRDDTGAASLAIGTA